MKQFKSLEGVEFGVPSFNIDFLKKVNDHVCILDYTIAEIPFSDHIEGDFNKLLAHINDTGFKDDEGDEWKNED